MASSTRVGAGDVEHEGRSGPVDPGHLQDEVGDVGTLRHDIADGADMVSLRGDAAG